MVQPDTVRPGTIAGSVRRPPGPIPPLLWVGAPGVQLDVADPAAAPVLNSLDLAAVARGAAVAVAVSLPASLVGLVVVDDADNPGLVLAFLLLVLGGLAAGGYVAGRRVPTAPLLNGAAAALAAFVLIQGIGLVRRVATGAPFSLSSVAFAAFLAYCCGLLGGVAASRRHSVGPT